MTATTAATAAAIPAGATQIGVTAEGEAVYIIARKDGVSSTSVTVTGWTPSGGVGPVSAGVSIKNEVGVEYDRDNEGHVTYQDGKCTIKYEDQAPLASWFMVCWYTFSG